MDDGSGKSYAVQWSTNLKQVIKAHGYTLQEVAHAVSIGYRTLTEYCAGRSRPSVNCVHHIAAFLGCSPSDLVFVPLDSLRESDRSEMDQTRRDMLRLLGMASSALVFPDHIDIERVQSFFARSTHLDETTYQELATINRGFWTAYQETPQKLLILKDIQTHLSHLTRLLHTASSVGERNHLSLLSSELAQLTGEIFFDSNLYTDAAHCYTFAAQAAKAAQAWDIWACALARHAFLPLFEQEYEQARIILQGASVLASRGTAPAARQWVAALMAQAYAGLGALDPCLQAFERAEEGQHLQGASNGTWLRFQGDRVPEEKGACFVLLKQPARALPLLEQALTQTTSTVRRRGLVLRDLALASLQQQHVEHACLYAEQLLGLVQEGHSGLLLKALHIIRAALKPYQQQASVKRFERHFREQQHANIFTK
uniref:HTH cro/C1-type domain-containing protein n=1 Tax=Thermosporothrix sp. COM3 TaxID=2490863 RepID=A0A455SVN1_9CHLR|nr:hypothetical protein KTC_64810 [Thermosporothrix sp. COM3]